MPEIPYSRGLNGGNEWEYFQPIRVGDRITVVSQIADIYERGGRLGNMVFVVRETIYTNQFGEKVAVSRNTGIRY
jgi:hydroxyacyl-ACP dehydratase HTD2-like protein with hotdog domain